MNNDLNDTALVVNTNEIVPFQKLTYFGIRKEDIANAQDIVMKEYVDDVQNTL